MLVACNGIQILSKHCRPVTPLTLWTHGLLLPVPALVSLYRMRKFETENLPFAAESLRSPPEPSTPPPSLPLPHEQHQGKAQLREEETVQVTAGGGTETTLIPLGKRDTCGRAAEGGHLEVLQWARQNGCPWDSDTCAGAAQFGHLGHGLWLRVPILMLALD